MNSGRRNRCDTTAARSFQRVEEQRQQAEPGRGAGDIGGADVTAAGLPDVLAAENAHQEKPEGDRSQQIAEAAVKKMLIDFVAIVWSRATRPRAAVITLEDSFSV